jgi:hypothetical protein
MRFKDAARRLTFAAPEYSRSAIYLSRLEWCVTPIQTAWIRGLFPSCADGSLLLCGGRSVTGVPTALDKSEGKRIVVAWPPRCRPCDRAAVTRPHAREFVRRRS